MALDMFLTIEGEIKGETQDDVYSKKDGIDVQSWSWGMSQSGSFHVGGGGGSGKAAFQDITITKWVDTSSPILMLYCANGDHFDQARLIIRKAGKKPLEYLTILMKKVLITSWSSGGSGAEDRLLENISLNFAECLVEYKKQKPDGSGEPAIKFPWNIAENVQK